MRGQAKLVGRVVLGVAAAAALLATPAQARTPYYGSSSSYTQEDPWCAKQKQNRMLMGAAIGGLAGAVLGNNVAARNAQSEGSIVGGVIGAASGAAIARGTVKCDQHVANQGYVDPGYGSGYGSARNVGYGYDSYGLAGAPHQGGGSDTCRWGSATTRDPDGREVRESVYMCRDASGQWYRR